MMTRTVAPFSYYAWFANNAYQATASDRVIGTRLYSVTLNRDVVKVWRSTSNGTTDCIVAWRGSASTGDWLRNIESQFGLSVAVPGEPNNVARIGHGYASRLSTYKAEVDGVPCNNAYSVTGHSLGGAMAEAYSFTIRTKKPNLEAYNPARVGNARFRTQLVAELGSIAKVKVYCRHIDPVWYVPVGLEHVGNNDGCFYWGPAVSWWNPVANHAMNLWL
jgi:Lipase (class 3)